MSIWSNTGNVLIDKPFIDMLSNTMSKSKGFTKVELEFVAKCINLPNGCCLCESKNGGLVVDVVSPSLLDSMVYQDWSNTMTNSGEHSTFNEDIKDVCSGNYIRR